MERTLGGTLRFLRARENLSVKTVIEELKKYGQEITDKTLYSYENDKRAASADMLLALCQIYKCNNILETFAGIKPDYSIPDDLEWKMIERYRALDAHGKEMVDFTLLKEWERANENNEHSLLHNVETRKPDYLILEAAHNDAELTEEEIENMNIDLERLDNL